MDGLPLIKQVVLWLWSGFGFGFEFGFGFNSVSVSAVCSISMIDNKVLQTIRWAAPVQSGNNLDLICICVWI